MSRYNRLLKYLPWLIIALGVILRLAVYLQNRNLIIDEANIARNIYERDFAGLLSPLKYEQFAPPVFLWILKSCSILFGFSEYSLRLYPLIAGLGSLIVMYFLLKELVPARSAWYALFLLATAYMFLRYSTEVKQYMGDVLFMLSILLLAIKMEIESTSRFKFLLVWVCVGSIAIWTSMPSVFALASAGCYYFLICIQRKDYQRILPLIILGAIWGGQFIFYYNTILKHQAGSDFLQNSHAQYFLYLRPHYPYTWRHNWEPFSALLKLVGDNTPLNYNVAFNTLLLVTGTIFLLSKNSSRGVLILLPVVLVLLAAGKKQFTLMPRVALFIVPVLLIIISYGLEQLYKINNKPWKVLLTILAIVYAFNGNSISMLYRPFKAEQLTEAMSFVKAKNIQPGDVVFYHSSGPARIYYTQIHPQQDRWAHFKNSDVLRWHDAYDSLAWQIKYAWQMDRPMGFIFTNATEIEMAERTSKLNIYLQPVDSFMKPYARAYIYVAK